MTPDSPFTVRRSRFGRGYLAPVREICGALCSASTIIRATSSILVKSRLQGLDKLPTELRSRERRTGNGEPGTVNDYFEYGKRLIPVAVL
jgi:hypothetical protein